MLGVVEQPITNNPRSAMLKSSNPLNALFIITDGVPPKEAHKSVFPEAMGPQTTGIVVLGEQVLGTLRFPPPMGSETMSTT